MRMPRQSTTPWASVTKWNRFRLVTSTSGQIVSTETLQEVVDLVPGRQLGKVQVSVSPRDRLFGGFVVACGSRHLGVGVFDDRHGEVG